MDINQQTAVEWLEKEFYARGQIGHEIPYWLQELFEQAKAMEKEQIIKSHCDGFYKSAEGWNGEYGLNDISNIVEEINAEQYYNQTFNN